MKDSEGLRRVLKLKYHCGIAYLKFSQIYYLGLSDAYLPAVFDKLLVSHFPWLHLDLHKESLQHVGFFWAFSALPSLHIHYLVALSIE